MINILAADPSLTAFGWATNSSSPKGPVQHNAIHGLRYGTIGTEPKDGHLAKRLSHLATWLVVTCNELQIDLVLIEEPIPNSPNSNSLVQFGGLAYCLRMNLYQYGIPWVDVNNAHGKKWATGNHQAKKAEVLTAAVRHFGYTGSDDNEADALWMLDMGISAYQHSAPEGLTQYRHDVLGKITWPEIKGHHPWPQAQSKETGGTARKSRRSTTPRSS